MSILEAIVSGIIQGITEILPVSSSGHLILVHEIFGIEANSLSFDVALHLATLIAVLWVLREEVVDILRIVFSKKLFSSLGIKIVMATIPAGICGFLLSDNMIIALRSAQVVAISLIFWGIILYLADVFVRRYSKQRGSLEKISWFQSIVMGFAQAIALIPGTSRSGITMSAGMFAGLDKVRVAKFSFLLSIPAIFGAGVLSFFDAFNAGLDIAIAPLLIGCVTALVCGIFSIKFLLRFLQKGSFLWFAVYRVVLGVILLVLFV
ncbi:undecaprenyl-diphosphatase UppP [Patescibacteria group bacterium]|nr:undecaprenyl-diphosphatase UppP [Patescibacteria group bacterium]MBU4452880.1 undecaprenyl-diphosphatase UppP [Patescibacteria group bacterium]MCG2687429.1 undecaprenyl-diphosphatase UppP [Candidatus Parcubacteria bacterium]